MTHYLTDRERTTDAKPHKQRERGQVTHYFTNREKTGDALLYKQREDR